MNQHIYWLWFTNIKGIGAQRRKELLRVFDTPEKLFYLDEKVLRDFFLQSHLFQEADLLVWKKSKEKLKEIESYYQKIVNQNVHLLSIQDEDFPSPLREIYEPPHLLFYKGTLSASPLSIGIVGSRRSTRYGQKIARQIASELASAGVNIVSGMALGIDGEAHWGAIEAGGTTYAILGNGVEVCYPPQHKALQEAILRSGALFSEEMMFQQPETHLFPKRNRLISGMCQGVLVVEAAGKSGSLITAHTALEQGRDVFAVPGRTSDPLSVGTNKIIQAGAKLVTCTEDILEEYAFIVEKNKNDLKVLSSEISDKKEKTLDEIEKIVYSCISLEPVILDKLINCQGMDFGTLNLVLMQLELKGLIEQLPNRYYVRK